MSTLVNLGLLSNTELAGVTSEQKRLVCEKLSRTSQLTDLLSDLLPRAKIQELERLAASLPSILSQSSEQKKVSAASSVSALAFRFLPVVQDEIDDHVKRFLLSQESQVRH